MFLVLLPIIAGLISSYLTYYFAKKSKKSEVILKFKEEKYANLLPEKSVKNDTSTHYCPTVN